MPQPCPDDREETPAHRLFGLRRTTPCGRAIAGALNRREQLHHDLPDLGMSEETWARLFVESNG